MQIEIIDVKVENKGKYRVANATYKGPDGKVDAKKVMSFVNKDVFKAISEAQNGDKFDVKSEKNEGGYWEWKEAVPAGKSTGGETPTQSFAKRSGSTYETSEERAKRQVYIVRQSSITAALELAQINKQTKVTPSDIISLAREFEAYVFETGTVPVERVEVKPAEVE